MAKEPTPEMLAARRERIEYIINLANELGYTPTRAEIPEEEMAKIKKCYNSWAQVICEAGLENSAADNQKRLRRSALNKRLAILAAAYRENPQGVDTEEYHFLRDAYIFAKKIVPKGFKPIDEHFSLGEIRAYLRALADELGYTPTMPLTFGAKQVLRRYKNWYAALEDAGLERTDTLNQMALRMKAYDEKFKELLKDTYEKMGE